MESVLEALRQEILREEEFCIPDVKKSDRLRPILKSLYDLSVSSTKRTFGSIDRLLVDGFDEEFIWEELQSRSKPLARFVEKKLKTIDRKIAAQRVRKQKARQQTLAQSLSEDEQIEDDDEEFAQDSLEEEEDDEEGEEDGVDDNEDDDDENDSEEEEGADPNDEDENEDEDKPVADYPADFDEDVKMEAWLDAFEEMEQKHKDKMSVREKRVKASTVESREWEEEQDDEEDDLEFIGKTLYEDSDDEDEDPSSMRFEDFFVDESKSKGKGKTVASRAASKKSKAEYDDDFDEEGDDDDEDEDDEDDDRDFEGDDDYEHSDGGDVEDEEDEEEDDFDAADEEDTGPASGRSGGAAKSSSSFGSAYQRRTHELASQIKDLEQSLVAHKSWELLGEVKAASRPENSLLEVVADVDRSLKVAPVITQEFTTTLEERIIERIKANRFDDPQRRAVRDDVTGGGAELEELSQEKSKVGLGELYAQEYAKKLDSTAENIDVQTQTARDEAINLFNAVSRQLDALTHFFFTPKPVAAEANAKVLATQRAMPALDLEDITPFTQNSTASALAPEQIMEKKRGKKVTLLTTEEMTREDRKKLRKHSKAVKKAERKEQAKDTSISNQRKQADRKLNDELRADKRVVLANEGNTKRTHDDSQRFAKSSDFFSRLQQDTQQQIANKSDKANLKRKRDGEVDGRKSSAFKL